MVLARGQVPCGSKAQRNWLPAALECTKVLTGFYLGARGMRVHSSRPNRRLPSSANLWIPHKFRSSSDALEGHKSARQCPKLSGNFACPQAVYSFTYDEPGAGDSKPIFCSWLAQMGDRRPTTALRPAWFTDASGHLAPSERRSCQDGQDNGRQCHHAFISIIALTRCTPSRDRIASVALQRSV